MKGDRLYLVNIAESIELIEVYTRDGREAFFTARMAQDAVVRHLEIIGEATKRLTPRPARTQEPGSTNPEHFRRGPARRRRVACRSRPVNLWEPPTVFSRLEDEATT